MIVIINNFIKSHIFDNFTFATVINNLSLIFHYSFLSVFIIKITPKREEIRQVNFFLIVILILIIYLLVTHNLEKHVYQAFSLSGFGLSILCLIYYYQLFNNLPILNLRKEPSFWIVTGVFFCMSIIVPSSAMIGYLKNKISEFNLIIIHDIATFSYLVMHVFFIKAFLCSIQQRQ